MACRAPPWGRVVSLVEGAWWGDTDRPSSTNGGAPEGQVLSKDPRDETLKVIYDAPNAETWTTRTT